MDRTPEEIAQAAMVALVTGDVDMVNEVFSADVIGWSPTMEVVSAAQLVEEVADQRSAFSDIELSASPAVLPDGTVAAEWIVNARHTGVIQAEDVELPPTGKEIVLRGAMFAEISGGRVVNFRQYWNEADLLEQLGLLE